MLGCPNGPKYVTKSTYLLKATVDTSRYKRRKLDSELDLDLVHADLDRSLSQWLSTRSLEM
jgi:hypothetical protein